MSKGFMGFVVSSLMGQQTPDADRYRWCLKTALHILGRMLRQC